VTCLNPDDYNEDLRDLWRRRQTLSRAEWGELYRIVVCVLRVRRLRILQALPGSLDEYILDFFQDKVMRVGPAGGEIAHTGALVTFFRRYLIDCLRDQRGPYPPLYPPPDPLDPPDGGHDSEYLLDQVVEFFDWILRGSPPGAEIESVARDVERYHGIRIMDILDSAQQFLAGAGDWSKLKDDSWWIRLYLRFYFCPEKGDGVAMKALAQQYDVRSYFYKAVKLGIKVPKAAGAAALEAFRKSYRGQWLASLGIPVDEDHRTAMDIALKILCLAALNQQAAGAAERSETSPRP